MTVVPPVLTESEQLYRDVEELLHASQSENPEEEKWQLPASWKGEAIYWEEAVEDSSVTVPPR